MIKNVIFDMGNVLIRWSPKDIVAHCGLSPEDSAVLLREVFFGIEWVGMDHGIMSPQEGYQRICTRLPAHLYDAASHCVFEWWEPMFPVPGMKELVREVKELGFGVYLLSNAAPSLHEYFPRIPGSEYFDGIFVSADVRLLKPQREIFELMFQTFGLKPEECFFIDDSPVNIEGAYVLGMPGAVFFDDFPRLRSEMRAAGIPVNA